MSAATASAAAARCRWRTFRPPLITGRPFRPISIGSSRRRSEEHTSELQSPCNLVCRLLLEKKKTTNPHNCSAPVSNRDRSISYSADSAVSRSPPASYDLVIAYPTFDSIAAYLPTVHTPPLL